MQIIDVEQGSEEWLQLRLGVATASQFSKIVTSKGEISKSLEKYALELASQILTSRREDGYESEDMKRGVELEPEARMLYQEYTLDIVETCGFMSCGDYGYSPDGLVGSDGLIEIKCTKPITHIEYLMANILPTAHTQQVQGGLMVSGRQWCDFISYNPDFEERNKLFIKRVYRDEAFIAKLRIGIDQLIEQRNVILNMIASQPSPDATN